MKAKMSGASGPEYALIDCGDCGRLERIGGVLVARPAPAAEWPRALPDSEWKKADVTFSREHGWRGEAPEAWRVRLNDVTLRLRPASGGQIGAFPEHANVRGRLEKILVSKRPTDTGWRALSLFGHTGLATLSLARDERVIETVHVDAQSSAVRQGKDNAALSGLSDARIRWLVDDAAGFLARERRRNRRYDVIVADPPAYGRDRRTGGEWKLERDLPGLVAMMNDALSPDGVLCLSCHPVGRDAKRLQSAVTANAPSLRPVFSESLALSPESGAPPLPLGLLVIAQKSA